jgi:hypothetical protein
VATASFASMARIPCLADAGQTALRVGNAEIHVEVAANSFELPNAAIFDWIRTCANAVAQWLGEFPVREATVRIVPANRDRGVANGTSWGDRGAECRVSVGTRATSDDLDRDWVLTHELFHFAFPSVPERHHWIEEGLSTYAEPIARAAASLLSRSQVWSDMMRDMPKGMPQAGDLGLDETHTWGRTYWGGALFCLLADVGIREATANGRGLRDAIRGVNRAGGNITSEWPLVRAFETADRATGTKVMSDLYQRMGSAPAPVDLQGVWERLGVSRNGDQVSFNERAPLAQIRAAMVR